jgi:hypothetical protein
VKIKNLEFFLTEKETIIIKYIKDNITSNQTQKTVLSALYILTDSQEYKDIMLDICKG